MLDDESLDLPEMKACPAADKMDVYAAKIGIFLNSLPNDNFLDYTIFKAFADDKPNLAKMMTFVFNRVENFMGKGENAGYQHFLLFPQCFQKASY